MNLNSVERIQEYTTIPTENYHPNGTKGHNGDDTKICHKTIKPDNTGVPTNWPHRGEIEFKHIYLKYLTSNDFVLRLATT